MIASHVVVLTVATESLSEDRNSCTRIALKKLAIPDKLIAMMNAGHRRASHHDRPPASSHYAHSYHLLRAKTAQDVTRFML